MKLRIDDGYGNVDTSIGNFTDAEIKQKIEDAKSEKHYSYIVECSICSAPAFYLDPLHPNFTDENRCLVHG